MDSSKPRAIANDTCGSNIPEKMLTLSLANKYIVLFHWLKNIWNKSVDGVDHRSDCMFCAV